MVDVITCAIFGDCRLRGVGVVRGVSLPSPIDWTRRLTTLVTLPCDVLALMNGIRAAEQQCAKRKRITQALIKVGVGGPPPITCRPLRNSKLFVSLVT